MHKRKDEKSEIKKFGIGLTVLLCLIGGWQLYKGHVNIYVWFFGFGGLVLVLSFFAPVILKPLYKVTTTVGNAVGWVNTRILLGIIFYVIFTPIGILLRIIRKDLLDERLNKEAKSYWRGKDKGVFTKEQYERQY
ncbi:MAG: hypothetical protein SCARUB_01179 [Candidatus Scalindua rubra]|uniref:SxtJ n=1 Tax=Candidatus Scalindua rubra TaxID=1872076 RepID=A0A1E3XDK5_9BACT|nr:MAG: hypothetical protein SCARUB_01179 [Candidatus Scalindua rubra]